MNEPRKALAAGMEVTPNVRLRSPIGAGGMGAVWLADHLGLNTRVVVKFMLNELDSSVSARARFKREAEAASQVKSPHVVQTFDYGVTPEGVPFIVMEHLEGRDLAREIADRGALEPAQVVHIVQQVARALTKAHASGLFHRDIKPDNIFLVAPDGDDELFVKILDFGIAKNAHEAHEITLDGQTKTGQVVGTPFYMSPEQVTAQKTVDHRVDVWSLGVVAFEALTGKRPYDGPSFGALAVKIATGEPPKPSAFNPALPPSVDEWFAKACARDSDQRFQSARELSDALRNAFEGILSLPPAVSGNMSDSGPRPRQDTPPISIHHDADELASTKRESSGRLGSKPDGDLGDRSSLARSEPGAARPEVVTSPPPKGLTRTIVGTALGTLIIAGAVGVGIARRDAATTPITTSTVTAPSAPASLPSPVVSSAPSAAASVASIDVVDAATPAPSIAPPPPHPVAPVPPAKPVPSAKPIESAAAPAHPATRDAGKNGDPLY